MKNQVKSLIVVVCLLLSAHLQAQPRDSERLGMALDYYCSGKYYEALVIFERLDSQYQLNPRFHAYMGMCYYHERLYDLSCKYFDESIPQLGAFSPIERFTYYYSAGDSYLKLEDYAAALPYFEQALSVCPEQRKTDVLSRLEWCRTMTAPAEDAQESATEDTTKDNQEDSAKDAQEDSAPSVGDHPKESDEATPQ